MLDVTDPENPAYCFQGQSYDVCERFPEYRDAPLDAHRYLSLYYNLTEGQPLEYDDEDGDDMVPNGEPDGISRGMRFADSIVIEKERQWRNSLLNAVEELANVPIIPASTLREAWPYDEFASPPRSPVPLPSVPSQATPNGPHGAVLALADMSLDIAVKHSILSANTTDIEKVLWLPGKAAGVKALLHALEPFPSSALHLLSIALKELKETSHIDLTGFHLRGAQVATILSTMDDPCSVDLSDNTVIVADEILDLIAASSSIRRIVLMGCSSVDGGRLLELVRSQPTRFRSVEGILHPAFCSLGKPVAYPSAFSCASWMVDHSVSRDCVSIPFFTAAQVVQAIADVIPWRDGLKSDRMRKSYYMSSALYAAFQSGTRRPGQSTRERTVMTVPRQSSRLSLVQKSLWTFIWKMPGHYGSGKAVVAKWWGFVHITRQEPQETDGDPVEMTIYDLQGFLQCMAQEGRPMPSDEAVVKLEKILYLKDEETGEYCCPLMKQEHLSEIK